MKSSNLFAMAIAATSLAGVAALFPTAASAGSCCGGGSAASLLVPSYARAVADISFDAELYDGFWDQNGVHKYDPPGSDLRQYRLNLGYAHRFFDKWQASITVPYVWNHNQYSGTSSSTDGLGDITTSLWYDLLQDETAWRVRSLKDMVPSVTLGLSLLLPTGYSPYDEVDSSFDVTGRGFYRLDGNLQIDKTIQPWNASLSFSYGTYFERSVNREYGKYVEPYRKELGDRIAASASLGYTWFFGTGGDSLMGSVAYSFLHEDDTSYNGVSDHDSGLRKQAVGGTITYASTDRDWSIRAAWNHAIQQDGWGENFPTTDIITAGVRYVFR